jgi:ATP synthase F1 delta subunit
MAKISRRALARIVADKLSAPSADGPAIMRGVAAFLVENRMTADADVLINDIADELFNRSGRLVVEVTSAHTLTEEARANLVRYLKDSTAANKVEVHETVNEHLIGGLIAKTPSAELDVSVRSRLRQLTSLA